MPYRVKIFLSVLFFLAQNLSIFGGTFWNGLVTYDPPIPMSGGDEPGNEGVPITGFELRHEGGPDGYAQVTFQVCPISILFIQEIPKEEIKTIPDLKKFADSQLKNATNASTAIINFNGKQALATTRTNLNSKMARYSYETTFFLKQNPAWLESTLFRVWAVADNPQNFKKIIVSLQTVKIDPKVLIPKLATNEMQLGISPDEIRKRCGMPFERSGPDEFYIARKYLIEVQYRGANDNASLINYTRLRDSQEFLENPSREALKTQVQPLDENSVKEILTQQTNGGKLKWASIAKNRWKRSDGAMAALTSRGLMIATAESWPQIRLPE